MFGSEMRRLRLDKGLSIRALANQVRYDYSYLSRIEQGKRKPPVKLARLLDQVLNGNGLFQQLLAAENATALIPQTTGSIGISTETDLTEARRRALQDSLVRDSVSATSLDDWEITVARHATAAKDREPSLLLVDLVTDFGELQPILASCHSALALRRLTRVAAHLSGLMCLTLIKLDERRAFRRWARTARLVAAEVGDPATSSWVLAQEAYGHFYSHDLDEAVGVARHAQAVADRSVGGVLAAALEARAHAVRRDSGLIHEALAHAKNILLSLDGESTRDATAFGYNEA